MISTKIQNLFSNNIEQGVIYHYTTIDRFIGILESKLLHLTYIGGLNDVTELEHGIDCFHEIFKEATRTVSPEASNIFDKICSDMKEVKKSSICVGSFCKFGDLLGQWRAYANDGVGLAIGFDTQVLRKICELNKFHFSECFYESELKKKICHEILKIFLPKITRENKPDVLDELYIVMLVFSLFLKDTAFEEEVEVRIATPPEINLDVKKIGDRWISYYPLSLKSDFNYIIKDICVGPGDKQLELFKVIEVLLGKYKVNNCSIRVSKIPYRSLRSH